MRRYILSVLLLFFLFVSRTEAVELPSAEHIQSFESRMTINQDTSLSIRENILYYTPEEKHGIFRYIPERYKREGRITTNEISGILVTDTKGQPLSYEVFRENGNVVIKIGDPNMTFSGTRTYVISYRVADAIRRQSGFDELYWDITGEGWSFPILSAKAEIISDFATIARVVCFTGPVGGTESECKPEWERTVASVTTERPIDYGDNFTVAVMIERENTLIFPSVAETWGKGLKDNWTLFLLPLPSIFLFIYWYRRGRDYRFLSPNVFNNDPKQPQEMRPLFEPVRIPMVYEPLKDLTPGEAGALLDESVDNRDIISEIIDLCRKRCMKIERVKNTGFLKWGYDYVLTKIKEPDELPEHQQYLMEHIFDSKKEVKLTELKGKFYTHMAKVKEIIYEGLTKKKYFSEKPRNAVGKGIALAVILNILVFIGSIESIVFLGSGWPVLVMVASFIISIIFSLSMTQKTAVGTNLSLQAQGLRETLRVGRWREEIKEKHLFIEEILPFAVAFGVIGKLTKDMAALNIAPPAYFSGGFAANNATWSGFVNDFSKSAQSGLSYNPSSSSTGRSGFSGGSSGGGGGGGGGGSW